MSAPVSRDPPSPSTGRQTSNSRGYLTAEQRDAAKIAGISDKEYAVQFLEFEAAKRAGSYPGNG